MVQYIQLALGASGDKLGADEVAGIKYQFGKLLFGADGTITRVSEADPLPVHQVIKATKLLHSYEDTNFVTAESGRVLDFNTDLGRNARDLVIRCDGSSDSFTYQLSYDAAAYSPAVTIKTGEVHEYRNLSVDRMRLTWVTDSPYRITVS